MRGSPHNSRSPPLATLDSYGHDFALSVGGAQIQESKNLYGGSSAPYTPERPY